jgi:hypothetical protein
MSSPEAPSLIQQLLQRVEAVNKRCGFMAWDPEKLALVPGGDPGLAYPRLRPPTQESPRLFISYGWSRDQTHDTFETDFWVDAFAGFLFGRGYEIVFDRDPRNFDKHLSWQALLMRMNDCNYFVPIISDAYIERIASPDATGAVVTEWNHAVKAYPEWLTVIGIWHSGAPLPEPLTEANSVRSYRQLNTAKFKVVGALEDRLPASPYWHAEWVALGEGKDWRKYLPLTHLEQWVPVLFGLVYVIGFGVVVST